MIWQLLHSAGATGSEGGTIVHDEEHGDGARLTLERGARTAPWTITCGVYGVLVHTRYCASHAEADREVERTRAGLEQLLATLRASRVDPTLDVDVAMQRFLAQHPT